ncbi:MAG: efflux RND transporter periplasmic adaptor subunit, partial [Cyclobacteriaceae bacterium]
IESLNVNFTGDYVRKGQVIASVYSPTLVTAQQELFEARKLKDTQPALFKAAKRKLANWKLSESQIEQILSQEEPITTFSILAESTGYVKEKMVNSGDYLKQGASLYTVSNLSRVWVLFDAYEADLQWIRVGNQTDFTVASIPGKPFAGEVTYIDPIINPNTRVAKVRVELDNEGNTLKPEMFVNGIVETQASASSELTVPKSAVMWTGKRSVVYVKSVTDQGVSFRMREIALGSAYGDSYAVIDGLSDGDEIAVNGTFSIDAAAQLAGKPSMMSPEGGAAMTGHNHGGMQMQEGEVETKIQHPEVNISTEKFESSAVFKDQIKNVFLTYLPLKDALIETDAKTAKENAKPLLDAIAKVDMTEVKGEAHIEWMKDLAVLQHSAEYITKEADVEKIRSALSPLSDQLYQTIVKFEVETGGFRQYCPMAFNNTGAFWLSNSDSVLNPYFGDVMLTCGNIEEELN